MADNLTNFDKIVAHVGEVPGAEDHVRRMVGKFAKSCPLPLLKQLGECVIAYRKMELRQDAERN